MEEAMTSLGVDKRIKSTILLQFMNLAVVLNQTKEILRIKSHSPLPAFSNQLRIPLGRSSRLTSSSSRLCSRNSRQLNSSSNLTHPISKLLSKVWVLSPISKLLSRVSVSSLISRIPIRTYLLSHSFSLHSNSSRLHIRRKHKKLIKRIKVRKICPKKIKVCYRMRILRLQLWLVLKNEPL